MDFEFTDEQKLIAESIRRSALAHLERGALERAHNLRLPFDVAKLMSEQELIGITLTEPVLDRRFDRRPHHADATE